MRWSELFGGAETPVGPRRRWRPSRLFLFNWWRFAEEEISFVHGHLVLRGANGSGKSTILASALPMLLDGRKDRMDPFGSRSRTVSYYLVGDPKATAEHDFFHQQRTGYLALELTDGRGYRTIGIGLYANRNRAGTGVDSWYFSLEDGRRIGRDFSLLDAHRIPLTVAQLRERVGQGGVVVQEVRAYQELVNRLFFGFEQMEEFHDLMNTLLLLRSPKLSRDIKPSLVAETLRDSLPTLEEAILTQATRIIQDLDELMETAEDTLRDRDNVRSLTEAEERYFIVRAQRLAAVCLEATAGAEESQKQLRHLEDRIGKVEAGILHNQAEEHRAGEDLLRLDGELQALEGSEALQNVATMQELEQQVRLEQDALEQLDRDLQRERSRLGKETQKAATDRVNIAGRRVAVRESAGKGAAQAAGIHWPFGQHWFDALAAALDPGRGETIPVVETGSLEAAGLSRDEALTALEEALARLEAAERQHEIQHRQLQWETGKLTELGDKVRKEEERLQEARASLRTGLQTWQEGLRHLECSDADLAGMLRLLGEEGAAALPRRAWEIFEQQRQALRQRQERMLERLHRAQGAREDAGKALAAWLEQGEAHPPVSLARAEARRRLQEAGVAAEPLYRVVRPRGDLPAELAARLEGALLESGLLDGLVVQREAGPAVARVLTEADLADAWIRPTGERGAVAPSLHLGRWLEPEAGESRLAAADIQAALQAVDVSNWGASLFGPDGTWQLGALSGTAGLGQVRFLGASARLRYFQEEQERLERALEQAGEEHRVLEAATAALDTTLAGAEGEAREVAEMPGIAEVASALAARSAMAEQEAAQGERCTEAERKAEQAWRQVKSTREQREEAVRPLPEAATLNREGVQAWRRGIQGLQAAAAGLAERIGDLEKAAHSLRDLEESLVAQRESITVREGERGSRADRLLKIRSQYETLQHLLAAQGTSVQDLLARVKALQDGRILRSQERERALQNRAHLEGQIGLLRTERHNAREEAGRRETEREGRQRGLEDALAGHPALAQWLETATARGTLAACESLLDGIEAQDLGEREEGDRRRLTDAFYQRQLPLQHYHPQLDGTTSLCNFQAEGRRLGARGLLAKLEEDLRVAQLVVEEKEETLYQEVVLKEVSHALREQIQRAHHWVDRINHLLVEHPLGSGEVLSLVLRPRKETSAFGGRTEILLELLAKDARVLNTRDQETLVALFRDEVNRLRQEDRSGSLPTGLQEALSNLFDYRLWFEFVLRGQVPGGPKVDLTDARFGTRSGAEKSLAVFMPLLAAVTARFDSARPDALRLIGMDEAFAGVDEVNTQQMFRFLTELDCDFIMTSEKLWGVGAGLSGCATWEILHQDNLPVLIPYRWDGQTLLALSEVAATREGNE